MNTDHGPADLPAPRRSPPVDLESFSRIVRRSRDRARELVGRLGAIANVDDQTPLTAATDEWLAAVEELEVAEKELRQQTDELEASAATVASQLARYQELFELAPDAYLVSDAAGAIQDSNRAAAVLFRSAREYLNGKPLVVFVEPEERRAFRQRIDCFRGGNSVEQWEMRLRPRYGAHVDVSVAAAASRDTRGRVTGIRWIIRDVTDQRRATERLREITSTIERQVAERTARLEQMIMERDARLTVLKSELSAEREARLRADTLSARRGDLLGMLSHEVRTPLHASQGYLELLELSAADTITPVQRGYVERMRQCQGYLVAVLEGVLELARLERGVSDLELTDVGVDTVLATIPALVEPLVCEKGLRYEQPPGEASVTVRVDREKLQQIVLNLVTNAVKFTPAGGLVAVSWEACDEAVAIRVRDTGAGIAPADLERIFEPFVQGAMLPSGAPHGVGLGLAISRQLALLMGGDLTVASTLGEGATFTLRLPRLR